VGETLDPTVSRMTLVVSGDEFVIEQVTKQLHKLIRRHSRSRPHDESHVERELDAHPRECEPSTASRSSARPNFRAMVVDVTQVSFVSRPTGDEAARGARRAAAADGHPGGRAYGKWRSRAGPKTRVRKAEARSGRACPRPARGGLRGLTPTDGKGHAMPAKIYYDQDADPRPPQGKKIAIIGYGSQGTPTR